MKPNLLFLFCLFILTGILSFENANAQMFWNQGCSFAGSASSYIVVRNSPELDITGSFTIEAWVNPVNVTSPAFQIILQKRNAGADGYTLYLSNGKVAIRTGATTRLTGQEVIPSNTWSHIAGTYNSATNTFVTYVNGNFDTSAVVALAAPLSNSDSILIGKGSNSPFEGVMDEVRIWNKALSGTEVDDYRRTSLGSSTGPYSGLVLSLTFQDNDNSGPPFSLFDWSGNSNFGFNKGTTTFDMSNRPLQTIQTNDCIELDGSQDYLSAADAATVSPTTQLTISAWIFMRSYANSVIIHKGGATGGASTNYRLGLVGKKLSAGINGNFLFSSDDTIPLHRWTHVTFTYLASLGAYQYHINGKLVYQGTNALGNITDGTDSLYIGGTPSLTNFDGYIDEVRIIPDVQYTETINQNMFKSIDLSNGGAGSYAVYNLDGYAYNNSGSPNPLLNFRGNASFAHCGEINDQPQSPINRADNLNFQSGYYQKAVNLRIPASGFSGTITDSLNILLNESISDVNVFVAINHNEEHELEISLINPSGNVVQLYNNNSVLTNADHVTTIFDDNADSSLNDLRYVSFSPRIKPYQSINSALGGSASGGYWKLNIRDITNSAASDTGMLYGWGIQINNRTTKPYFLNTNSLVQGFYNSGTNLMIKDTMRYYIRNTGFPYGIYDSAKAYLTGTGFAQLNLPNVSSGVAFYLELKHRNSLETWSNPFYFDPLSFQAEFDFRISGAQAYGGNLTNIDNVPTTFGIWGADVDQDGIVDASDVSIVDNDAFVGLGGYVRSDVTGDNFVDAQDQSLADNNSAVSVTKIVPPGAGPLTVINPELKINTDFISGDPNLQSGNSDVKSLEKIRKYPESEK
ncbi:MAG: proprotein convertase P-domain-containing protein [Ignavibacteria bacterium]|nr:proprotein convertase P-domain-containing protein [Ignavibacteria bacterium]